MTKRTLKEIDAEERQLRSRLIELEVELKNNPYSDHPYDSFIEGLKMDGKLQPDFRTPRDLKNEREAIQRKLDALVLEKQQLPAKNKKAELQYEMVLRRVEEAEQNFPDKKKADIFNELADELNSSSEAVKKSYYDGLKKRNAEAKKKGRQVD